MGAVGINFSSDEDEARAAVAGMLMLGPMSRQECMIAVTCNDNNENGIPCLYVYREDPDDTETIDCGRIRLHTSRCTMSRYLMRLISNIILIAYCVLGTIDMQF